METIKLLSVVALLEDIPVHHLQRGEIGTVVETLESGIYEVEFSDDSGRTYASVAVPIDQLIVLRNRSQAA
jgi:hypothetical protein